MSERNYSQGSVSQAATTISEQQHSVDDIQIILAPHIQTFLAQSSRRYSCCNVMLPLAFERAASKSWLNPKFDSPVLETQYQFSIFPQIRLRFRFSLLYLICMAILWLLYFLFRGDNFLSWTPLYSTLLFLIFISLIALWITFTKYYRSFTLILSGCYAILFILTCLAILTFTGSALSILGHFTVCIICIICIYTVIPLPFWCCFLLAFSYSAGYEIMSYTLKDDSYFQDSYDKSTIYLYKIIAIRVLLHLCVHLVSIHMLLMSVVRMRGTFMKVGQNLLVRRQLEMEKQLKEKMITSMMPKVVADMLLKETGSKQDEQDVTRPRNSSASDLNLKSMFRPFHMHSMSNVSILFADIVGFTKMSSKKTAEQLVEILNDLFERFDDLCMLHGCEKISTLGDCYYCVSGCPNAKADHAICCAEMGLGMIEAMRVYDSQKHEGIKMRVGIHTGDVLCGIVGTKRVKFDVWSNDVNLANKMESTGQPDHVHISEETRAFLDDSYILREGDQVEGHRTYFILGKKSLLSNHLSVSPASGRFEQQTKKHRNLSTNDIPSIQSISPAIIQQSKSLSPSPILQPRKHRLASISGTVSKLLSNSHFTSNKQPEMKNNPKILIDERSISEVSIDEDQATKLRLIESPSPLPPTNCDKPSDVPYNAAENGPLQNPINCDNIVNIEDQEDNEDMFDLKSYISQSRCDVSPFNRSGSYRSQHEREQKEFQAVQNFQNSQNSRLCNTLSPWYRGDCQGPEDLSPSRKDSGVRSNSRRSSIQQQLYHMNKNNAVTHNRVSGYFTSSQSSLVDETILKNMQLPLPSPATNDQSAAYPAFNPTPDPFAACVQHLRKQSDLQLIKCVRDNARSTRSYLVKPPLHKLSLYFKSELMESIFRNKAHRYETENESGPTLATPKFNTFIDVAVLSVVYMVIAGSLFLLSPSIYLQSYKIWVCCFVCFTSVISFVIFLCAKQICRKNLPRKSNRYFNSIFAFASNWLPWHFFGSILISIPVASILISFAIVDVERFNAIQFYYGLLLFVCLIHFCNFIQLNCWSKNILAFISACSFMGIAIKHMHEYEALNTTNNHKSNATLTQFSVRYVSNIKWFDNYEIELFLDLLLLLILVMFLNWEFEIGYRLSFYGNEIANADKSRIQHMKNQADILLNNIIPKHVTEQLKNTAKYSENHKDVGIIFASIVNFNELYDESYLGGKEYLRVLNELIGDFDELLARDEFKSVEKIKTIGSTYMAASGLDSTFRKENSNEHLYGLLDFAVAMQNVIETFNRDLLEFNLVLRIGFNYGDVTAGVIGTTKLYYDIWSDAVNIASRMDSTGLPGKIQIRTDCLSIFEDLYEFEPRGQVYVKGKDFMNVSLLKAKKPETLEIFHEIFAS